MHLKDADAASRDTVVHEANHSYMDDIYTSWPVSDCPSPHFITGVSGKGCALSEGWTYMIVAAADGNPVYTWPSGATLNLETPNCNTANWDDGGRVEGRVGGVLIDLIDPFDISFGSVSGFSNEGYVAACGGDDRASGMFDAIWDLFYDQDDKVFVTLDGNTNSFSNAWESRQYPRYAAPCRSPELDRYLHARLIPTQAPDTPRNRCRNTRDARLVTQVGRLSLFSTWNAGFYTISCGFAALRHKV
ncbi:MAG: hypothetical protein HZY76_07955 [Anaerolineae bacterium]|nr:MAG: hypothetical protein HZY76_07955 [Anaerolineae bacterium]